MNRLVKLTDATTKMEVHINPDCVHAMSHLAPEPGRIMRTRLDVKIGDRGHCFFVLESPTEILKRVEEL